MLLNTVTLFFAGQFMVEPTTEQGYSFEKQTKSPHEIAIEAVMASTGSDVLLSSERPTGSGISWVDFKALTPVACPCGLARRAFHDRPDVPYTMHVTEILDTAKPHFHKQMTETYFILECESGSFLELDGKQMPLVPGMACLIPPGVVHRAVGRMKVLIVVTPKFDSRDEFVVE